jgi:hypothetical protein
MNDKGAYGSTSREEMATAVFTRKRLRTALDSNACGKNAETAV